MALDNVTSHFSTVLEPITSASSYPVFLLSTICTLGSTQLWQNSRAVQREGQRAHLCLASLLTLKSLLWIKNIGEDWEGARIHLSTLSYQNYKTQTVVPKHCELQHFYIQLFRERLSEKLCTRQSQRVIWGTINTLFLTL